MAHDIPSPGVTADVASLAEYRLALLPDPITAVGAVIPPRPDEITPWAPSLTPPSDPVAAIESVLADLEGSGRDLGAVVQLLADDARVAAEESRRRLDAGTARPLEGLAFGVKDVIQVEGSPTTFGSPAYDGFVPETTAQVVRSLRDAGAILVAKLATYEFASGPNSRTSNPWGAGRRSGGSSSGSASAVGAGLLPLALGTDSGGSIRVPAAWCGAVGMKPTRTRVPTTGVPPLSWHLDHTGTLTRTVSTAAAVLGILAGEGATPASHERPSDPAHPLAGMRVGVLGGWFRVTEPEVGALAAAAIDVLADLGADLVSVELPLVEQINPDAVKRVIVDAESAALHDPHRPGYGDVFAGILSSGAQVRAVDYIHALRLRVLLADAVDALFDSVDALVCATSAIAAPLEEQGFVRLGGADLPLPDAVARNTSVFNISGHPALTVPSGLTASGQLPAGLQIVAPHWRDDLCFKIGMAYENRVGTLGRARAVRLPEHRTDQGPGGAPTR